MVILPNCLCCGPTGCSGSLPTTSPLTAGQWIPSGVWAASGTGFPGATYNPGATGKTWFFFGSLASSNADGTATTAEQQDWNNLCNWYSEQNKNPFDPSGGYARFTARADSLPPSDATVFFYSTPKLDTPKTLHAAYLFKGLQAGDTLTCTGTAYDASGTGSVVHGATAIGVTSSYQYGTLVGGALYCGHARLYGALTGDGEWRGSSRLMPDAVVTGNASTPAGTNVDWAAWVGGVKTATVTGNITWRSGVASGVVVHGNFVNYGGTFSYSTIKGQVTMHGGALSYSVAEMDAVCYGSSSVYLADNVFGNVTCNDASAFSGVCQQSVTCNGTSTIRTPATAATVTLNDSAYAYKNGSPYTVTVAGAFTAYDSSYTNTGVTVTAGSCTFNNSSLHGLGSTITGDCTFNGTSTCRGGVNGTATFNDSTQFLGSGNLYVAVFNGSSTSSYPSIYTSATFNDNACTTALATASGLCPNLSTIKKFVTVDTSATQICNGTAPPWACPPSTPSCGCDNYP